MKKGWILSLSIMSFLLSGCSGMEVQGGTDTMQLSGFEIIRETGFVTEVRNLETGVHYYRYSTNSLGGLAPVYESDGSIRVTLK